MIFSLWEYQSCRCEERRHSPNLARGKCSVADVVHLEDERHVGSPLSGDRQLVLEVGDVVFRLHQNLRVEGRVPVELRGW